MSTSHTVFNMINAFLENDISRDIFACNHWQKFFSMLKHHEYIHIYTIREANASAVNLFFNFPLRRCALVALHKSPIKNSLSQIYHKACVSETASFLVILRPKYHSACRFILLKTILKKITNENVEQLKVSEKKSDGLCKR